MTLTFDHEQHSYRWDGELVPSVSRILADVGLSDVSFIPEAALIRGRAIHSACEMYDQGVLDEASVDPTIQSNLLAWKAFREEHREFCFDEIETPRYQPMYAYACTPDRLGFWRHPDGDPADNVPVVIELKSNSIPKATRIQLAAQAMTLPCDPKLVRRIVVCCKSTGEYEIVEYSDLSDFDVWTGAVRVWMFRFGSEEKRRARRKQNQAPVVVEEASNETS